MSVYANGSSTEYGYDIFLTYPFVGIDEQCDIDTSVYGPLTAEQSGYLQIQDLNTDTFFGPRGEVPMTYTTVQDGKWGLPSTWLDGEIPPVDLISGDVVNIDHRVELNNDNIKLFGSAELNVNHILKIHDGNIEIEGFESKMNLNTALVIIPNGSVQNKNGTVTFDNSGVQLCNDDYQDTAGGSNGTFGSGYIYALNGNIQNLGSGNFSNGINWCTVDGNGDNLPVSENCSQFVPTGGCEDESFMTNDPYPRDCDCSPIYKDSNFEAPKLIHGDALEVGAVYRFKDVFPSNPYGTTTDALVRIEEFSNGASLLEIDVTSSGLPEAFQPRINSTNQNDQSVLFSITFVEDGGNYGDEVEISVYGTPLDIDGDGDKTREYAEVNIPDAYFVNNNTVLDITQSGSILRGETTVVVTAPGDDVSLDPRFTFSNYWENVTSVNYRIGKLDGDDDRYYSLDLSCAEYDDPNSVFFTYPVICGNVSDESGDPLEGVDITITGSDGSSQIVQTDAQGNYKGVAEIPEANVGVTYEIRESDPAGYISISDVDGANDNLITREIELASSCDNDFVDGFEGTTGWNFECGDDKIVDEIGYNANCQNQTIAVINDPASVYQYVVEIVYKGDNPGQTLDVVDAGGTTHTLVRSVPVGGSSNIWVYRGLINGSTSSITYNTTNSLRCKLQSVVIYAFRNAPNASSSSGVFTSRSGYNDIQTITIDVPAYTQPRDLIIETPISELTDDGRYLLLRAEAGGVSDELFLYGPDSSLPGGSCCLAIPSITLPAVPGTATHGYYYR